MGFTDNADIIIQKLSIINYKGCEMDEKRLHLIIEVESMEKAKEFSIRPDIVARRVEAGAFIESTVMMPLKD